MRAGTRLRATLAPRPAARNAVGARRRREIVARAAAFVPPPAVVVGRVDWLVVGRGAIAIPPAAWTGLPVASVAVARNWQVPGTLWAWLVAAPAPVAPSPNDHVMETGDQTSNGDAENATGVPAVPVGGTDSASRVPRPSARTPSGSSPVRRSLARRPRLS